MPIDLRSDNTLGASPEIVDAVTRAADGALSPYGNDEITERVRARCREIFETDADVVPVITGTAGNSLAIASMTPSWGAVFCHTDAHIQRDELGAPEFFTGGAKLIPVAGADGKLNASALEDSMQDVLGTGRMAAGACVSLTQATEAGTVYSVEETAAVCAAAHAWGAGVHVDGARFANALVRLGCSPAAATWRAGVDALVFGATKNGAMGAELLVVFRKELTAEIARRAHRSGHRLSKMRFLAAQFDAYLTDELWLRNARRANEAAARLERGLRAIDRVEILRPVEANILFVRLRPDSLARLRAAGHQFYDWEIFGAGAVRLVTGFNTDLADVDAFLQAVRATA